MVHRVLADGPFVKPPKEFICCEFMEAQFEPCTIHQRECPDFPVRYNERLREFTVHAINATFQYQYCLNCGKRCPDSLREEWYRTLEESGIDGWFPEDVPEPYNSDKWWREKYTKSG